MRNTGSCLASAASSPEEVSQNNGIWAANRSAGQCATTTRARRRPFQNTGRPSHRMPERMSRLTAACIARHIAMRRRSDCTEGSIQPGRRQPRGARSRRAIPGG